MIHQWEFLLDITRRLAAIDIPYMITGSYGSLLYGEPRTTNDVDIVIESTAAQVQALIGALDTHHYASLEAARQAVLQRSMFNIIDTTSGWKVDLIIRKSRPYSVEEFQRRTPVQFHGQEISVVTAEDAILSKLEWAKTSGSERQIQDAQSVVVIQGNKLDVDYLGKWAPELGVEQEVERLLIQAEEFWQ